MSGRVLRHSTCSTRFALLLNHAGGTQRGSNCKFKICQFKLMKAVNEQQCHCYDSRFSTCNQQTARGCWVVCAHRSYSCMCIDITQPDCWMPINRQSHGVCSCAYMSAGRPKQVHVLQGAPGLAAIHTCHFHENCGGCSKPCTGPLHLTCQ